MGWFGKKTVANVERKSSLRHGKKKKNVNEAAEMYEREIDEGESIGLKQETQ